MPFAAGELVAGRFELRRKLGAGGLAEGWIATTIEEAISKISGIDPSGSS